MSIKDTHDAVYFLLNKWQTGPVKHEEVDIALHLEQLEVYATLMKVLMMRDAARNVSQAEIVSVEQSLAPFFRSVIYNASDFSETNLQGTGPNGIVRYPVNVYHLSSVLVTSTDVNVPVVRDDEASSLIDDQIKAPVKTEPIAVMGSPVGGSKTLRLYPRLGNNVTLNYYISPSKPLYAYDVSGRSETHRPDESVDLAWDDVMASKIVSGAVARIREHHQDGQLLGYSDQKSTP